jgi:hypothetical protein
MTILPSVVLDGPVGDTRGPLDGGIEGPLPVGGESKGTPSPVEGERKGTP